MVPVGELAGWPSFAELPPWRGEVGDLIKSRGLDPDRIDQTSYWDSIRVGGCLGAGVYGPNHQLLSVISRREKGAWAVTGHRFLTPMWSSKGKLANFSG